MFEGYEKWFESKYGKNPTREEEPQMGRATVTPGHAEADNLERLADKIDR